jgi:hypothetical protein
MCILGFRLYYCWHMQVFCLTFLWAFYFHWSLWIRFRGICGFDHFCYTWCLHHCHYSSNNSNVQLALITYNPITP